METKNCQNFGFHVKIWFSKVKIRFKLDLEGQKLDPSSKCVKSLVLTGKKQSKNSFQR